MLTPEQYARKQHDTPYLYTLGSGDEALTFIGARHTTDTHDELYSVIPEQLATARPDVVVVEGVQSMQGVDGMERFVRQLHRDEAITRGGESIFTIQQALVQDIPWFCPEPTDATLMRHLTMQLYTASTLTAWYLLRLLGQYHRRDESMPFQAYAAPFLAYVQKATGWSTQTCSFAPALQAAEQILGHTPNLYNRERAEEYTDPIPWPHRWELQTPFNDITRDALRFRDRCIVKRVGTELLRGKRVLVVYGAGHAVMQEPAYRFMLET